MKDDSAGARIDGGVTPQPQPQAQPRPGPVDELDLLYCRCGTPMHPEHLDKRRGVLLERYCCPRRRWWNGWHHPHAWMTPRENVPS